MRIIERNDEQKNERANVKRDEKCGYPVTEVQLRKVAEVSDILDDTDKF